MDFKKILLLGVISVIGIVMGSFFIGGVWLTQSVPLDTSVFMTQLRDPFSELNPNPTPPDPDAPVNTEPIIITEGDVNFVHADLIQGWVPWVIKQVSILIGGLALIIFFYAGVQLIIGSDNEDQLKKSTKMLVFGVVGIALAAFSYSIVANVLGLFAP